MTSLTTHSSAKGSSSRLLARLLSPIFAVLISTDLIQCMPAMASQRSSSAAAENCVSGALKARGLTLQWADLRLQSPELDCAQLGKESAARFNLVRPSSCEGLTVGSVKTKLDGSAWEATLEESSAVGPTEANTPLWDALRRTLLRMIDAKCQSRARAEEARRSQ